MQRRGWWFWASFSIIAILTLFSTPFLLTAQQPTAMSLETLAEVTGISAWHQAGYDGSGAKVGIIDVGFGGINNLSTNFTVPDGTDPTTLYNASVNHGTLVFEILHSLAPAADYYLFQLTPGGRNLPEAVDWMIAQQVDVVNYSASTLDIPLDGTNYQAQQVGRMVDSDIVVVTSVGNHGVSFVSEIYRDANGDGWHEFEGAHADLLATPMLTEMFGETHLRWEDNYTSAEIDLDLYIFTNDGSALWDASTRVQQGGAADWSYEDTFYPTQAGVPYLIRIRAKTPGSIPDGVHFYLYADDTQLSFITQESSLAAPADSPKVLAVGAIESDNSLWWRSAHGPSWDGRIKPDLVAPTRITLTTITYPFTGTSASAPVVAAAAAITRGAFPNLSEVETRHWLITNAVDLGEVGADNLFGNGRVWLPPPSP